MTASTRIVDWLGQGVFADRPAAATLAAAISVGGTAFYYATDTNILYALDRAGAAWDTVAGATLALNDLSDVIISGAASNDFIKHNGTSFVNVTPTVATAALNALVGDSGTGGTKGLAPAPAAGDAAAAKFLKADATWAVPAGGASALTDLSDVTISGAANGDFLKRDATDFKNVTSAIAAQALLDAISTTQGTVLYNNGTDWVALSPGTSGQVLTTGGAAANPSWAAAAGGSGASAPQGRLTLTSGTSVMSADVTAGTTAYYTAYIGNKVTIAGTTLTLGSNEISMGFAAANHLSGNNYDIFVINNAGTAALCTGPAWTSTTARGTGAGTTELSRSTTDGLLYNAQSMTNAYGGAAGTTNYGPVAAGDALYLGSVYCTSNGTTQMVFNPAAVAGGTNNFLGLYNAYNRVLYAAVSLNSTASYTYATNTWRAAGGVSTWRATYLDGLAESLAIADWRLQFNLSGSTNVAEYGVVFDSTTATPSAPYGVATNSTWNSEHSVIAFKKALGLHYAQPMELVSSGTLNVFPNPRSAVILRVEM